ncbi:MAG: phosphatase PAP2 family protein [Pseudomonadales bacterium]
MRLILILPLLALLGGCLSAGGKYGADARWPTGGQAWQAARDAALEPGTWVPVVATGVLMIDNADGHLTDWAMRHQPVFGSNADDDSNVLQKATAGFWLLTALAAPSETLGDKVAGLSTGLAAVALEGAVSTGLKEISGRERPNRRNDKSFPSGHAGRTSALATLTAYNVNAMNLSEPARLGAIAGAQLLAAGTAWARVEAGKHHVSDVLVGNALGHFIGAFVRNAFLPEGEGRINIGYVPMDGGGALTLSLLH